MGTMPFKSVILLCLVGIMCQTIILLVFSCFPNSALAGRDLAALNIASLTIYFVAFLSLAIVFLIKDHIAKRKPFFFLQTIEYGQLMFLGI